VLGRRGIFSFTAELLFAGMRAIFPAHEIDEFMNLVGIAQVYATISISTASGSAPQRHGKATLPSPRDTTNDDERYTYTPSSRQ
jgi:hypothetical protein